MRIVFLQIAAAICLVIGLAANPIGSLAESSTQVCQLSGKSWQGRASYYSTRGCLGCSPNRRMANGEILDDNKFTLAFMRLPLNTWVRVTNHDNGMYARARVTDRGGFEPYGRIADLSKSLADYLEMETDQSVIEVSELHCSEATATATPEPPATPDPNPTVVTPERVNILGIGIGGE